MLGLLVLTVLRDALDEAANAGGAALDPQFPVISLSPDDSPFFVIVFLIRLYFVLHLAVYRPTLGRLGQCPFVANERQGAHGTFGGFAADRIENTAMHCDKRLSLEGPGMTDVLC